MSAAVSIIGEVESALHGAPDAKRVDVLRRVTDLFVADAPAITPEQTALFDGVIGQLIHHIESRALAELSSRLAPIANAPLETIRTLARHDDLEISGPILESSERLTDDDLIAIANTKSNGHLARISGRARLAEAVTDVLVERGDADVAHRLATNAGARFSQSGMAQLVMRADKDDRLTGSVAQRSDVPSHLFRQLLAQATDVVRNKFLASAPPDRQRTIKQVLDEITARAAPKPITAKQLADAQHLMSRYAQDTVLLTRKISEFANLGCIAEVIAGLSLLSAVPCDLIQSLFAASNGFGLMVLCKTLTLDWPATHEILAASRTGKELIEDLGNQYDALSVASAQRLFRFWRSRQAVLKQSQKPAEA